MLPMFGASPPEMFNHTRRSDRGQLAVDSGVPKHSVSIPSRDKLITMWQTGVDHTDAVSAFLDRIDSEVGPNYRTKLIGMLDQLKIDTSKDAPKFSLTMSTASTSTHGSLVLLGNDFNLYGLHDLTSSVSYLMWGSEIDLKTIRGHDPKRFLVYRFDYNPLVFLPCEAVGAKWWRWVSKNLPLLQAFNALELRLSHGSTG